MRISTPTLAARLVAATLLAAGLAGCLVSDDAETPTDRRDYVIRDEVEVRGERPVAVPTPAPAPRDANVPRDVEPPREAGDRPSDPYDERDDGFRIEADDRGIRVESDGTDIDIDTRRRTPRQE